MNASLLLRVFALTDMKKYGVVVFMTLATAVLLPLLVVFSMGSATLSFLNGTTSIEDAATQGFYMGPPVEGNTYAWGNCTYWTFAMRLWADDPIPTTWGNANTWDDRARADGFEVNQRPRVGSIMQSDAGEYGHVAYVTAVDPESGRWVISEMNAPLLNVVSTRIFSRSDAQAYSFIHGKIETAS